MRFIAFIFVLLLICLPVFQPIYCFNNQSVSSNNYKTSGIPTIITDFPPVEEGQYILHKDRIDSEIEILKEKYPVLKSDVISYKFLFAPKYGGKQFFESDGSPFVVIKIYSKSTKPGDMITISAVKYKDPADSTDTWKNFDTTLLFVFE